MLRFFQTLVDPFQPDDNAQPPASVWGYLVHNLRPFRWVIAVSLVFTVINAGIEVWLIGYAGSLVDMLAASSPATLWALRGGELLLVALIVVIARPLTGLIREALNDIAFRPNATFLMSWRAHKHVLRQPVGWFRNDLAGRISSMVQITGGTGAGLAYSVIHTLVYVTGYILGSIGLMAAIDASLVIPLLIWLVLYLALMAYCVPRLKRAVEHYQELYAVLSGTIVDTYANIDTVKLFTQSDEDREGRQMFERQRDSYFVLQRLEVTMNMGMLFLGSLLMVGLIGYAIVLWQAGSAPVGLVAIAVALSFRITAMGEWLLDAVSSLFTSYGALNQALKTVAQPLALVDAPDAKPLAVGSGAIRFSAVSHHYGKDDGGLDLLSLDIAGGEKVGLVGRSGAGKSTLVNLVLRFFDPESGSILIDGQDIGTVRQDTLRRHISMVTQEATLLHRSVRDNIAYGRSDVSAAQIEAAARQAEAHEFILGLADRDGRTGYDTLVGERGVKLSGGQRQRVALARAILKDAPILILDEATSALDSEVEAAIQSTLYGIMEGKTVIAIAHRLSTIARMDRIVVLDRGRIAEQGTHQALLDAGGIYAGLWARQSGGFLGAA
ncbi:MAG: ABC transporter ATP-binding protein [Hyphomicrobiales bacterium]|nr:MAG: ABC transporter ATP-binding protein [Hyphomicrobiales bacterium]